MRGTMLLKLAARDLVRQRRRALMAVGILAVGVCAVLFTRGWQSGMLDLIEREGAGTWLGAVQVRPPADLEVRNAFALEPNLEVSDELKKRLTDIEGVHTVSERIRFFGRLFHGDVNAPFIGIASDMETAPLVVPRLLEDERLESGSLPSKERDDEILVASPLAEALALKAGDSATILARPVDGGLEGVDVRVSGIVRASFEENQKRAVIVDIRLARRLLRMEGRATQLLLGVEPLSASHRVAEEAPRRLSGVATVEADPWDVVNPRYQSARVIWGASLGLMLVVVLLVASLGLSTTLVLVIYARTREVGTLAALGLRRRHILTMFLVEGALLGACGGFLGAALAFVLTRAISQQGVAFTPPGGFTVYVRPTLLPSDLVIALVAVTSLAALVSWLPAWRAATRPPSESMR